MIRAIEHAYNSETGITEIIKDYGTYNLNTPEKSPTMIPNLSIDLQLKSIIGCLKKGSSISRNYRLFMISIMTPFDKHHFIL